MRAVYQNRRGATPTELRKMGAFGSFPRDLRITPKAATVLERANVGDDEDVYLFRIPPTGIVVVQAIEFGKLQTAVRHEDDEPFTKEVKAGWREERLRGDLWACPECGAALIWWETGYCLGYRVCAGPRHHHVLLTGEDGVGL